MRIGRTTIAGGMATLLAAAALGVAAAGAQEAAEGAAEQAPAETPRERCFGVAEAGKTEGIGLEADTTPSTVNFQGNAWSWVPLGTCQTITPPVQADGTPRRGAIRPLSRDPA